MLSIRNQADDLTREYVINIISFLNTGGCMFVFLLAEQRSAGCSIIDLLEGSFRKPGGDLWINRLRKSRKS